MAATATDVQVNSANVSSGVTVSDEEEVNEDDNISLEDQDQAENENFSYSPETLLSLAGNLEFVVGKVAALSKRLRSAAFIDAESMLNEVIFSCNKIFLKLSKRWEKLLKNIWRKAPQKVVTNVICLKILTQNMSYTTLEKDQRHYHETVTEIT